MILLLLKNSYFTETETALFNLREHIYSFMHNLLLMDVTQFMEHNLPSNGKYPIFPLVS